jgi:hypothetical protein
MPAPETRPHRKVDDSDLEAETAHRIQLLVARANLWRRGSARTRPDAVPVESAAS